MHGYNLAPKTTARNSRAPKSLIYSMGSASSRAGNFGLESPVSRMGSAEAEVAEQPEVRVRVRSCAWTLRGAVSRPLRPQCLAIDLVPPEVDLSDRLCVRNRVQRIRVEHEEISNLPLRHSPEIMEPQYLWPASVSRRRSPPPVSCRTTPCLPSGYARSSRS